MTVLRQLPLSTVHVLSTPCIFPPCAQPPLSFFLFYFHLMKLPQKDIILRPSGRPNLANKFSNHIFLEKCVCSNYLLDNQESFAVFFLSFITNCCLVDKPLLLIFTVCSCNESKKHLPKALNISEPNA